MPRNFSAHATCSKAAYIADTFWASQDLMPREVKELARYGVPPALRMWKPVRADLVVFGASRFEFVRHGANKEEGVRAFLFLITNDRGEALRIVAWAPLLYRSATWLGPDAQARKNEAVNSAHNIRQLGNQEAA